MKEYRDLAKQEAGARQLAALLRHDATLAIDPSQGESEWKKVLLACQEQDPHLWGRPKLGRFWVIAPLVACLAVVAIVFWRSSLAGPGLRFVIDGSSQSGSYIESESDRSREVRFSDGSQLKLRSFSCMRVIGTDSDGATLSLERGQLDLSIRHRPSARWRLDVGPYLVRVIGTRFNVAWDPNAGDVRLDLLEGVVDIRGPGISVPIVLQAGQRFQANKAGTYAVEPEPEAVAPPAGVRTEPEPQRAAAAAPEASHAPSSTSDRVPSEGAPSADKAVCNFEDFVASGQFDKAVAQVRLLGAESTLAKCSIRNLFALADAARYVGNFDLSKTTLLRIRKRSPGDASKAEFFLGRLEEARGNAEVALGWYAQAASGSSDPHIVQEARAGRDRVVRRVRDLNFQAPSAGP